MRLTNILNTLFIWVLFNSYSDKEFVDKINTLKPETLKAAYVQLSTTNRPHYILYQQEKI